MLLSLHLQHGRKKAIPAKKNSGGQSKDGSSRTDSKRRGSFSKGVNEFLGPNDRYGFEDMSREEMQIKVQLMQEELRQKLWEQQTYKFKMDPGKEWKL